MSDNKKEETKYNRQSNSKKIVDISIASQNIMIGREQENEFGGKLV
jgi:hypothetical protein